MKFHGLHIAAQGVKDYKGLIEWHKVNQPSWCCVMDGLQLARDIKVATPNTQVIVRTYKPDGFWYTQTPEAFLGFVDSQQIDNNLWVFVENESGINSDWNSRLIQANIKREHPRKLVLCNLSVGTDSVEQWITAAPLLRLADQYRDFIVLARHEYFNVVPTSGFIGGLPDNAGAQPDLQSEPGKTGRNFVPHTLWPLKGEVQRDTFTKFHCGRFTFMNQACLQLGIKPPRIVLTEHGQDDVSDIKQWVVAKVGEGIRGYKTLQDYWTKTFSGWSLDQTYYEMLKYLRQNLYAGSNVEGALIFCHSHIDMQWDKFDVEGTDVMRLLTEDTLSPIVPIVEDTPPPTPLPAIKPVVVTPPEPKREVITTPGGSMIAIPIEDKNWKFTFEVTGISKSEAETLLKLFPSMSAHIEQMKVA